MSVLRYPPLVEDIKQGADGLLWRWEVLHQGETHDDGITVAMYEAEAMDVPNRALDRQLISEPERSDYSPVVTNQLMYLVAWEITQSYGGPEEGGWWYDSREPIAVIPCSIAGHVRHGLHLIEDAFEDRYSNERERTSAAGGADLAVSIQERYPHPEPRERPHYE